MSTTDPVAPVTIDGEFRYPLYSPRGCVEGVMLHAGHAAVQLVFEPHGDTAASAFETLRAGTRVRVEAHAMAPSDQGEADHPLYRFEQLVSVEGRAPDRSPRASERAPYSGIVVRLNFARHGAPNGFVLDNGDFIHTRPEGMAELSLGVGDRVEADGDARPLMSGCGVVVEASVVNGRALGQPRRPAHA